MEVCKHLKLLTCYEHLKLGCESCYKERMERVMEKTHDYRGYHWTEEDGMTTCDVRDYDYCRENNCGKKVEYEEWTKMMMALFQENININ